MEPRQDQQKQERGHRQQRPTAASSVTAAVGADAGGMDQQNAVELAMPPMNLVDEQSQQQQFQHQQFIDGQQRFVPLYEPVSYESEHLLVQQRQQQQESLFHPQYYHVPAINAAAETTAPGFVMAAGNQQQAVSTAVTFGGQQLAGSNSGSMELADGGQQQHHHHHQQALMAVSAPVGGEDQELVNGFANFLDGSCTQSQLQLLNEHHPHLVNKLFRAFRQLAVLARICTSGNELGGHDFGNSGNENSIKPAASSMAMAASQQQHHGHHIVLGPAVVHAAAPVVDSGFVPMEQHQITKADQPPVMMMDIDDDYRMNLEEMKELLKELDVQWVKEFVQQAKKLFTPHRLTLLNTLHPEVVNKLCAAFNEMMLFHDTAAVEDEDFFEEEGQEQPSDFSKSTRSLMAPGGRGHGSFQGMRRAQSADQYRNIGNRNSSIKRNSDILHPSRSISSVSLSSSYSGRKSLEELYDEQQVAELFSYFGHLHDRKDISAKIKELTGEGKPYADLSYKALDMRLRRAMPRIQKMSSRESDKENETDNDDKAPSTSAGSFDKGKQQQHEDHEDGGDNDGTQQKTAGGGPEHE